MNTLKFNESDPCSYANTDEVIQETIEFDFKISASPEFIVEGETKITFRSLINNLKYVVLDHKDFEVLSVNVEISEIEKVSFEYLIQSSGNTDLGDPVIIKFTDETSSLIHSGQKISVIIQSRAVENKMWFNVKPEDTEGKVYPFCYILGACIESRTIYACQDTPFAKVTFSSKLTVAKPLTAFTSGMIYKTESIEDSNFSSFFYKQIVPTSTYLIVFAIGHTTTVKISDRVSIYCEEALSEVVRKNYALIDSYIAKAESLFGPFQWGDFNVLVTPEFKYYGMENPNLVFIDSNSIGSISLILHELTHFWFGNLVTNKNWENFWINEGITSYIDTKLCRIFVGEEPFKNRIENMKKILNKTIDELGEESTFTSLCPCIQHRNPMDFYNFIPYYKGCFLLYYIESLISEESIFEILNSFIQKFKFKVADHLEVQEHFTTEIIRLFPEKSAEINAKIDWVRWIKGTGKDILYIPSF